MTPKIAVLMILVAGAIGLGSGSVWASDPFTDGLALFNAGEWTRAASQLSIAASKNPRDSIVRMTAGVALANVKRYRDAAEQFRAATRLSPDGILPHLLFDGICAETGATPECKRAREQASRILSSGRAFGTPTSSDTLLVNSLEKHPQNAIAHLLLGDLYQLQNKLDQARQQYAKASELSPKWVKPVFNLGIADLQDNPKEAGENFGRVVQMDPSNRRAYLWWGDAYLEQNQVGNAIKAYDEAAKDKSLAAEAKTRAGNAQLRAGNYQAAKEDFALAAKKAPQDPRPLAGQGQVLQSEGKFIEAETKYNEAAEVLAKNQAPAPSQAVVQQQIGEVQMQQGKLADGISNIQLGHELYPTQESADALVDAQARGDKLQEGIARGQETLARNPKDTASMRYLLSAYRASGNSLGRIDMASRLAKADPADAPRYYCEIGAAHMALGNPGDGVEAFCRALENGDITSWASTAEAAASAGALDALTERCEKSFKASHKAMAGLMLFELQSARKDAKGMIETSQTLVTLNPDQPTYWLRLGQAYEQAGSKELAITAYSKAATNADTAAASLARKRIEQLRK